MKKLNVLKNLIDVVWIISCIPSVILLLAISVYMFFDSDILKIMNANVDGDINSQGSLKIFVLFFVALMLGAIYCFYLFRKVLRYYQKRKPFDNYVIDTYQRIGKLLFIISILGGVSSFAFNLIFKSEFMINIGFSPFILAACLGLFFMVLSETFVVAKNAKEDSDLSI